MKLQLKQSLISPLEGPAAMVAAPLTVFAAQETHSVNGGIKNHCENGRHCVQGASVNPG